MMIYLRLAAQAEEVNTRTQGMIRQVDDIAIDRYFPENQFPAGIIKRGTDRFVQRISYKNIPLPADRIRINGQLLFRYIRQGG